MDWEGIRTAILDRERVRLGLPTRAEEAAKRQEMEIAAATSASQLESAALGRERTRAEIAALPELQDRQRRLDEARIRNYDETTQPRAEPSTLVERIADEKDPVRRQMLIDTHLKLNPRPAAGSEPRTGWQPQYDAATGRLMGYYHPATETFRAAGEGSLPGGTRPGAIPAGEMEKRGLLTSMVSDAQRLLNLIGPENKPTPAGQSIGFYSGRANDIRRSGILAPLGVEAPPESINEMFHIADNMADMLLRARSGAQINENEYQRLRALMPDPRTNAATFRSNLSRFLVEANNVMAARQGMPVSQLPQAGAPSAPAADPLEGRTATGPNGQKLVRKGGQWVPL